MNKSNSLIERIQQLERENATLRSRLSQFEDDLVIAHHQEIASASIANQGTITFEQEQAAQQQVAELAQVNQALSIEIVERQRAEQLAQAQLETLICILKGLHEEGDLDKYLEKVMISISDQLQHSDSSLWFTHHEEKVGKLHLICFKGEVTKEIPSIQGRRPKTSYPIENLGKQRRREPLILVDPVNSPNISLDNDTRFWFGQRQVKSILKIPLFVGETEIGSLRIHNAHSFEWKPEEIHLAQVLSNQIVLAVQLTRLAEEAKQNVVLDERNRMARDIHDTLAQAFTGIVIQLEATKRKLAVQQFTAAEEHIAHARNLAIQGLSEARRSVRALRPEALESRNLCEALPLLAEQIIAGTELQLRLRIDTCPVYLPANIETNLLRIGQEALTNILKHAQAKTIWLELLFEADAVHLSIRDDGQGFDPQFLSVQQGFGLLGMQERSRQICGEYVCNSHPGKGTEVIVTVPLPKKA